MADSVDLSEYIGLLPFVIPLFLLALGFAAGRITEANHYKSIREREKRWVSVPTITGRSYDDTRPIAKAGLTTGAVVVSVDHFKRFTMVFRKVFGGELRSYSPLIDRGRREALLRMKEAQPDAEAFVNCRLITSTLSNGQGKSTGCVEIVAYATALTFARS